MNWGEFSRSADADQHPGAYLPPPNLTGTVTPPVEPPVTPPASCQCQAQIDALEKRVAELERRPPAVDISGKRIALMASNGRYVCADFEKGDEGPLHANRDGASNPGWETFTIAEMK
jgi:hypothetical protein